MITQDEGKIRVLIIDDSAFMRVVISDMIKSDADIEVAGTARNGKEGLEKAILLKPDIITLDIEMPVMNGLETL
ncbi:MAG TPA: response regulator, partial [Bacillota bacterium]|nr:response regulator [Bacillota bacterium]